MIAPDSMTLDDLERQK